MTFFARVAYCRPERDKVRPAHEKWHKIGGLWRAGRVLYRVGPRMPHAGRILYRGIPAAGHLPAAHELNESRGSQPLPRPEGRHGHRGDGRRKADQAFRVGVPAALDRPRESPMESVARPQRRCVPDGFDGNLAARPIPPVLHGAIPARAHSARDAEASQELGDLRPIRARHQRRREILRNDSDVHEAQQGSEPVLPRAAVQDARVRRASLEQAMGLPRRLAARPG